LVYKLCLLLDDLPRVGVVVCGRRWGVQVIDMSLLLDVVHGDVIAVVHVVHIRRD
jgi:hypothetical protein